VGQRDGTDVSQEQDGKIDIYISLTTVVPFRALGSHIGVRDRSSRGIIGKRAQKRAELLPAGGYLFQSNRTHLRKDMWAIASLFAGTQRGAREGPSLARRQEIIPENRSSHLSARRISRDGRPQLSFNGGRVLG